MLKQFFFGVYGTVGAITCVVYQRVRTLSATFYRRACCGFVVRAYPQPVICIA